MLYAINNGYAIDTEPRRRRSRLERRTEKTEEQRKGDDEVRRKGESV